MKAIAPGRTAVVTGRWRPAGTHPGDCLPPHFQDSSYSAAPTPSAPRTPNLNPAARKTATGSRHP